MPEDDSRVPNTIADFIGDNVNDIAGNCSDLLESFVATIASSIMIAASLFASNGSTSQASICGSTLALMDAGVPIKAPVAGISCGLITDGDPLHGGRWMTMLRFSE